MRCWGFLQTFSQIALKEHPEQKNRKEERKPQFSVDFASAARGASLAKRSEATASAARSCPGERCASGPRPPHPGSSVRPRHRAGLGVHHGSHAGSQPWKVLLTSGAGTASGSAL